MTAMLLAVLVTQAPATLAVIDISAEDAIYEDLSRGYAQALADRLTAAGVRTVRIDESELPPEGCKLGPCLGRVAKAKGVLALVTLDAESLTDDKSQVTVTLMRATTGEPLAGGRYLLRRGVHKAPKGLVQFVSKATSAVARLTPRDAGP